MAPPAGKGTTSVTGFAGQGALGCGAQHALIQQLAGAVLLEVATGIGLQQSQLDGVAIAAAVLLDVRDGGIELPLPDQASHGIEIQGRLAGGGLCRTVTAGQTKRGTADQRGDLRVAHP